MKVIFQKRFLVDLARLPKEVRKGIEKFVFEEMPRLNSLGESGKIERMKGYKAYYKARFGAYRVGFKLADDTVSFERVLHRKDIYRYFP